MRVDLASDVAGDLGDLVRGLQSGDDLLDDPCGYRPPGWADLAALTELDELLAGGAGLRRTF